MRIRARTLAGAAAGAGIVIAGYSVLGGDHGQQGGTATTTDPAARSVPTTAAATRLAPGSGVDEAPPGTTGKVEDLGPPRGAAPPATGSGTDLPSFPLPGFVAAAPAITAPTQPATAPPQVPSFSPPPPVTGAPTQPGTTLPQVPSFSPPLPQPTSTLQLPSFPNFASGLAFSSFPLGDPFATFPLNNPFATFPLSGFISSIGSGSSIFPNLPFGGSLGLGPGGGLFPLAGSLGNAGLGGGLLPSLPLGTGLSTLGTAGAPSGLILSIGSTFPPGTTIPVPPGTTPTGTTISVGVPLPTGTGLPLGTGPLGGSGLPLLGNSIIDPLLGLRISGLGDLGLLDSDLGLGDLGFDHRLFRHLSFDHHSRGHDH